MTLQNGSITPTQRVVFLQNQMVVLRPATVADTHLFVCWLNDPEIRVFIQRQLPMFESEETEFLQKMHTRHPNDLHLVIETAEGKTIGAIGLHKIDYINRTATTGTLIGDKEYWGKGYGTRAKQLLLSYAFYTLNLRKIYSDVIAYNARSIAYALKCGYTQEAVLKDDIFRDGKYHHRIILSLYEADFRNALDKSEQQ